MQSTTKLREFLLEAHGPVELETIARTFKRPAEPLAWLIKNKMVAQVPEGYVALDGQGKPVKPGGVRHNDEVGQNARTPGKDKGFRGCITTQRMSSRASAGGSAKRRTKQ